MCRRPQLTTVQAAPSRSFLSPSPQQQQHTLPVIQELGPINEQKLKDWRSCTGSQFYEYDFYLESSLVEGDWPPELQGTYLCNSPALPSIFGHHVRNLSDADGMVTSIAVGDGQVFFRNRFVRTPSFESEQVAGRRLHRGLHDKGLLSGDGSPLSSWVLNPLDMRFPSRANAGILSWAGKLYALSEHDLPFELSKQVLDTIGPSSLPGGVLQGNTRRELNGRYKVLPGDGRGQRLVLMSVTQSMMDVMTLCATVTFLELDESGKKVAEVQHRVPGALAAMITDFSVTDNWYMLVAPPVTFNPQRFATSYMLGDVAFAECLDFDATKPSKIHLVPRGQPQAPKAQANEELRKGDAAQRNPSRQSISSSSALNRKQNSLSGSRDGTSSQQAVAQHSQLSRPVRREPITLDGPPLLTTRTINSYECDRGRLVVLDAVCERDLGYWKDASNLMPGYYKAGAKPEVTRFVVDMQQPSLQSTRVLSHRSTQQAIVLPSHVGRPSQFIYSAAAAVEDAAMGGPPQAITKLMVPSADDVASASQGGPQRHACCPCEVWYPGDRCFPGPLMLLPKAQSSPGAEGDNAWLMCLIHDAEAIKAELVVLDAAKITAGPIARVRLPCHVPYASAVTWSRENLGPGRVLENLRIRGQLKR